MRSAVNNSPSIVIAAKTCGGAVVNVGRVENGANLIQRNPVPREFDIGSTAQFADAGDGNQFTSCGRDAEILLAGIIGREKRSKCIYARGGESEVPARWRSYIWSAAGLRSGNPAAMLQHQVFRGEIFLIGNDASSQFKMLRSPKCAGGCDQISGKTAGEKVAGRASGE